MRVLISLVVVLTLAACTDPAKSPRGFSLPEGDAAKGEQVLLNYGCLACHTLAGSDLSSEAQGLDTKIQLGGQVTSVKTYAALVTAVINPSHKFARGYQSNLIKTEQGQSKMPVFNDVMTVTELTDLVTFLQPHYELQSYRHTPYVDYNYVP